VIEGLQREAGRQLDAGSAKERVKNTAPTRNKVVTEKQLQAFKEQYGADKDLTDYMNQQKGLHRRGSPAPPIIELDEAEAYTRRNARSGTPGKPDQLSGELARNARSGTPGKPDQLSGELARNARSGDPDAYGKASTGQASAPMSREDMRAQIPTGGVPGAGPTPSEGNSASGSELGRNVKNTLNSAAGLQGVRMGQMAAEAAGGTRAGKALSGLMGGKQAAEVRKVEPTMSTLSAAEKAKLAGELRRGATPTNFTSPSRSRASKDTRFRDDEVGVDFRKGGSAKGYAKGGSVSSRADGIAQRGKTRGRMC
jgi:hypothetical protein